MFERVISNLQGACREGFSCIHTAFSLRETVAASMEDTGKCFVAFFDVAKALYGLMVSLNRCTILVYLVKPGAFSTGAILDLSAVSKFRVPFPSGMNPYVVSIKVVLCR